MFQLSKPFQAQLLYPMFATITEQVRGNWWLEHLSWWKRFWGAVIWMQPSNIYKRRRGRRESAELLMEMIQSELVKKRLYNIYIYVYIESFWDSIAEHQGEVFFQRTTCEMITSSTFTNEAHSQRSRLALHFQDLGALDLFLWGNMR